MNSKGFQASAAILLTAGLVLFNNLRIPRAIASHRLTFPPDFPALVIVNLIVPILLTVSIVVISMCLGGALMRTLRGSSEVDALDLPMSLAMGAGTIANIMLALGWFGHFTSFNLRILLAALAVVALLVCRSRPAAPRFAWPEEGADRWLVVLGYSFLAFSLWHCFGLPSAPVVDYDVLVYHLVLPKMYLTAGRIQAIPWLLMSHWPHLMDLFNGLALAVNRDSVAALLHLSALLALLIAVYQVAARWLDQPTAGFSVILLGSLRLVNWIGGTARIDIWWALFEFLAFVALWNWFQGVSRRRLVLAALLAGFAASTKLLGILFILIMSGWIVWHARDQKTRRQGIINAFIFASCALVIVLPWYIKTWSETGNPVWPFALALFGDSHGASAFAPIYKGFVTWHGTWGMLYFGPQYLLIPVAILGVMARIYRWRMPPFLRYLWCLTIPYALIVIDHTALWRFLLPCMPALVMTAGWYLARLVEKGRVGACLSGAFVILTFAPSFRLSQSDDIVAVLGLRVAGLSSAESRQGYISHYVEPYDFQQKVNDYFGQQPPGSKQPLVLLYVDRRGYYLNVPYMWGDPIHQGEVPFAVIRSPDELNARLRALTVSHVLWGPDNAYPLLDRPTVLMKAVLERDARPVLTSGPYTLFELKPG